MNQDQDVRSQDVCDFEGEVQSLNRKMYFKVTSHSICGAVNIALGLFRNQYREGPTGIEIHACDADQAGPTYRPLR